jgi:hypothetical protein
MLRSRAAVVLLAAAAGCSPTFNWREVRAEPTGLKAMLPCKPEQGSRRVPMAGREVELSVIGCDTGGATFAILHAEVADPARADEVLAQWRRATLLNMKAEGSRERSFVPPGAASLPASQRVSAQGRRADGSAVRGEAAYFARGRHVFQAVVYASDPEPETLQVFFEGLKFS